jgi:hypothetical protein
MVGIWGRGLDKKVIHAPGGVGGASPPGRGRGCGRGLRPMIGNHVLMGANGLIRLANPHRAWCRVTVGEALARLCDAPWASRVLRVLPVAPG